MAVTNGGRYRQKTREKWLELHGFPAKGGGVAW